MQQDSIEDQRALAQRAAQGDETARRQINGQMDRVIRYQCRRFCVRFCRENRYRYRCTLVPPVSPVLQQGDLCEWGNASYGWMLDELCGSQRLLKYEGRKGAGLFAYLYQIANSLPFYERWKDWRFGRHIHVPTYVQALAPDAGRVFLLLRANEPVEQIAQQLNQPLSHIEDLAQKIILLLTQKNKLHLLNPPRTVSLTESADESVGSDGSASQRELADYDEPFDVQQQKQQLQRAWQKLSPEQQFVIEALTLDGQDAKQVLQALVSMDISIRKGVAPRDSSIQQLYYFRRKALARLAELMRQETEKI